MWTFFYKKKYFNKFLEREEEGEREKHWCEWNINRLSPARSLQGMKLITWAYANKQPSGTWKTLYQLNHTEQGWAFISLSPFAWNDCTIKSVIWMEYIFFSILAC